MHKQRRKFLSILLALALLVSVLPLGVQPARAAGKTIVIKTALELRKFAEDVSARDDEVVNANVYLYDDINLENKSWTPIGIFLNNIGDVAWEISFNGTFDGQGHTISGLNIEVPGDGANSGLFASLGSGGTVKNLKVTGSVSGNNSNVGGIVGENRGGTVTNCTFATANSFTADPSTDVIGTGNNSNVGGVVGLNSGTVTNCLFTDSAFVSVSHVNAVVKGNGNNSNVGGIVGLNSGTVANCGSTNKGNVSSSGGNSNIGGIVGNNSGSVTACTNNSNVSVSNSSTSGGENKKLGGVVGQNSGIVQNSNNTGTVTVPAPPVPALKIGGVVGSNTGNSSVTNCYNTGAVNVTVNFPDGKIGGVVGENGGSASVTNCYYLTGRASAGIGAGGTDTDSAIPKDEAPFHSGEIAYLLQNGQTEPVWGQDLSKTDSWPTLIALNGSVQPVYQVTIDYNYDGAPEPVPSYTNGEEPEEPSAREGYIFDGWKKTEGEGNTITYTAQWLPYTYSIGVSPATLDFGSITEGDAQPAAQEVTITNTGNQTVTLNQPTAENFEIDKLSETTLEPEKTATFSVQPKSDLSAGSYSEQIIITGDNNASTTITASFSVNEPPYTGKYSYEVTTSVGDNGTISVDRYATEGDEVTIEVTPDEAYMLEDLTITSGGKDVEVTDNGDGTFTFTMPSGDVEISASFAEDPEWTEPEPDPSTDVSEIFLDVAPDAWYKDAVQYAYDNGLMTGVSATEFAPDQTTTRAMIVSILARLEGVTSASDAGFSDVDDEWFATAVNWAASENIVAGFEDNSFRPNDAITREQLAAILMNYATYKGEDVSARADLSAYSDADAVSSWAAETMSWAVAEGYISGMTADELQPQGNATRAQLAAILERFCTE